MSLSDLCFYQLVGFLFAIIGGILVVTVGVFIVDTLIGSRLRVFKFVKNMIIMAIVLPAIIVGMYSLMQHKVLLESDSVVVSAVKNGATVVMKDGSVVDSFDRTKYTGCYRAETNTLEVSEPLAFFDKGVYWVEE